MEDTYKLSVNGEFEYRLKQKDIEAIDILPLNSNAYHILKENISYNVKIIEADFLSKKYSVKVNSGVYEVTIADHLDLLIDDMGFALGSSKDIRMIEAPMPGLILNIHVREGQAVKEDDPLLILEAMKMENVITSPRDGIIKNITVKKGEAVEKNYVLVEFE